MCLQRVRSFLKKYMFVVTYEVLQQKQGDWVFYRKPGDV
ncbi:hypothetical protein GGD38_000343 [Chitinophagaceae bacterium OAS944]|nr:hypothetical protein [Chitinophagaceae bacterium OAS944]